MSERIDVKNVKRVVIKIGSSSLTHAKTGGVDFLKLERLVRELCNLSNSGIEVCLVSSGAIAVGRKVLGLKERPDNLASKQACAAVGQASLMMSYQKLFGEYHHVAAQVLMTKNNLVDDDSRINAENTFDRLFDMGVVPIVNENDTVSTYEIQFGDNDTLSALVSAMVGADLLILLSDIDGLYTDDPNVNKDAVLIKDVFEIKEDYFSLAKSSTGSDVGTGGMATKLKAARIATSAGADMVIANAEDVGVIHKIFENDFEGTVFHRNREEGFYIKDYLED
ncbi:MAG: glutamate 5-kinase [Lachnospiraceae bacterium]|nr:glutamate 5-kinase [Lachnospiraceae bacterium]